MYMSHGNPGQLQIMAKADRTSLTCLLVTKSVQTLVLSQGSVSGTAKLPICTQLETKQSQWQLPISGIHYHLN